MSEKYKVWVEIEKISNEGEKDEKYEDISPFPVCLGEFDSYEEAEEHVQAITGQSTLN
jgi:hypothetical protein